MGTKLWGPLGWMTLHSISAIYPENPTAADKAILEEFVSCFRETISCPYCKSHFSNMLNKYRSAHPEWLSNRQSFFLFVCRAHNTVNRRLDKPIYKTVDECIETLKNATKITTTVEFRRAYLDYLVRNWSRQTDSEGFMMMGFVRKMIKINDEYFNLRDNGYESIKIQDGNVLEFIQEDGKKYRATTNVPDPIHYRGIKIGFRNGSFVRR
jgi:hypothetical protein